MRLSEVSADEVTQAIAEFDEVGRDAFLEKYGFGEAQRFYVVHEGRRYDSKALLAAAYGYAFPDEGPLRAREFSGGEETTRPLERLGFTIEDTRTTDPSLPTRPTSNVWWVNQGMTYAKERDGGYVWAPRKTKAGFPVAHHTNVSKLHPGDVIVHYANSRIRALSSVAAEPVDQARPDDLPEGPWESDGHYCEVTYFPLDEPIALSEIRGRTQDVGPFTSAGAVKQGYLFGVTDSFAGNLQEDFSDRWPEGSPWANDAAPNHALAIYVGDSSLANFQFSSERGKWGWKSRHPDYDKVSPGDTILFCIGHDAGGPRQPAEAFAPGSARSLIIGTITSAVTREDTPFWPDERGEVIYPHRLTFEVAEDRGTVSMEQINQEFSSEASEAFRSSGNEQGRGVLIDIEGSTSPPSSDDRSLGVVAEEVSAGLLAVGLNYGGRHEELVRTFVVSLATKRFLLLTGLSGSGKTRLALGFGQWLGGDHYKVIAVRPDWTGPDALLGYEDGLSVMDEDGNHAWVVPDALQFMLKAAADSTRPYLLLLDEMNLAHVERYFADVLSGMESNEPILPNLRKIEDGGWRLADPNQQKLSFPTNLLIVGTVNIDETTYMFSPKVLDRANTIEFRVAAGDLQVGVDAPGTVEQGSAGSVAAFLAAATSDREGAPPAQLADWLRSLHGLLATHDREFGHRTFFEALRFSDLLADAGESDPMVALDLQVLQKVLPRFHGSARQIGRVLHDVAVWCYQGPGAGTAVNDAEPFDVVAADATQAALPRSFEKLQRMTRRLTANHFVSFAE